MLLPDRQLTFFDFSFLFDSLQKFPVMILLQFALIIIVGKRALFES
jgi:hypothetical protein